MKVKQNYHRCCWQPAGASRVAAAGAAVVAAGCIQVHESQMELLMSPPPLLLLPQKLPVRSVFNTISATAASAGAEQRQQ